MSDLTHDGITQSISEWALDYGIPARLIRERLKNGWNVERAITQPMQARVGDKLEPEFSGRKSYTHDGKTMTEKRWAERLGISDSTIRNRLKSGWSLSDALSYGRRGRKQAANDDQHLEATA